MFSREGELQASFYAGTQGLDPQINYSITNHLGIMINGSFISHDDNTTNMIHKHSFGEIGFGYYQKIYNMWQFEIYGGAGYGKLLMQRHNNINTYTSADANYMRYFIQPAIGLSTKYIDFSLGTRFVILDGTYMETSLSYNRSFLENAATIRIGGEQIKGVFQFGYILPIQTDRFENHQAFMLSIGVQVYLFDSD